MVSDRTEMTGIHLRKAAKEALAREAIRQSEKAGRSISMSALGSEAIEKLLRERGHNLDTPTEANA